MADLEISQFTNGNIPTDTSYAGGYKDANTPGGNRRWSFANIASYISTKLALGTIVTQDADDVILSGGVIDNIIIGGDTPALGTFTDLAANNFTFSMSGAFRTDTTTAHAVLIQAYDVDGTAYKTFGTLTNGNTPSLALSQPSGGSLTWDGGTISNSDIAGGTIDNIDITNSNFSGAIGTLSSDLDLNENSILNAFSITGIAGSFLSPTNAPGDNFFLAAWDVDGSITKTFGELISNNTPSLAFSQPAGGLLTWDGGTIGSTTPISIRGSRPSATTINGTTHTLALADSEFFQICSNAATQTITIPLNASVAFPINTEIDFFQQGAGQVAFVGEGGVTIQSTFGATPKLAIQYAGATIKKIDTDTWCIIGNITA